MMVLNFSITDHAIMIVASGHLYLDTETTGFGPLDEICEISIVDDRGEVVLDTLVKPTIPMNPDAQAVHGISDDMLANAPSFKDIANDLSIILSGNTVVIYNADYDLRMLAQSAVAVGIEPVVHPSISVCAMKMYTEFWGEPSDFGPGFRFQKLSNAVLQQNIKVDGKLHRALSHCQATRLLMHKMAGVLD